MLSNISSSLPHLNENPTFKPEIDNISGLALQICELSHECLSLLGELNQCQSLNLQTVVEFHTLFQLAPKRVKRMPEYKNLAGMIEKLYSQILITAPKILKAPLIDDRETRSTLFSTGIMTLENYDSKTGVMTLKFSSKRQYKEYNRKLEKTFAQHSQYALAKHYADKNHESSDTDRLRWLEKALYSTAEQIRKDGQAEWEAVAYEAHAINLKKSLKAQDEAYDHSITAMKEMLWSEQKNISNLFYFCNQAISLRPDTFEPHYFSLIFARSLAKDFPEKAAEIIDGAYKLSPLKTFNFFMVNLIIGPLRNSQESDQACFKAWFQQFLNTFPNDLAGCLVANAICAELHHLIENSTETEKLRRLAFSQQLAIAIFEFEKQNLETSRKAFSAAEHFHISDKRPYMYRVLIDLEEGDYLSSIKQLGAMKLLVRWNVKEDIQAEQSLVLSQLGAIETPLLKKQICSEYAVLSCLIKIYMNRENSPSVIQAFEQALMDYLKQEDPDFLWAAHMIDRVIRRLGMGSDYREHRNLMDFAMNVYMAIAGAIYIHLVHAKEDLSDYQESIEVAADGQLLFKPSAAISGPKREALPLAIDPQTLRMPEQTERLFLRELLQERLHIFGLFFIQLVPDYKPCLSLLDAPMEQSLPFYGLFLECLLERIDNDGDLEQKSLLVRSALNQSFRWPEKQKKALCESMHQWQLDSLVPTRNVFIELANEWHSKIQIAHDLAKAHDLWKQLRKHNFSLSGKAVEAFFSDWENHISNGISFASLKTMCLIKALLMKQEIMEAMPSYAESELHSSLIQCALSLVAREGTALPYVVPNIDLSKAQTKEYVSLYLGQRLAESELDCLSRMKDFSLSNSFADLRKAKHIDDENEMAESDKKWMVPPMRPHRLKNMCEIVDAEISLLQSRISHTEVILKDRPGYTQHEAFIRWVEGEPLLVSKYLEDSEGIRLSFNQRFANLPEFVKKEFFNELHEKADHEVQYRTLKNEMQAATLKHGHRFWQLILQTVKLIESVQTSLRSAGRYNIAVKTVEEARFVTLLIYEWSLQSWKGSNQAFAEAFHGPEIHIWGKGPRIFHYNAGIFANNRLENVHIYYS